MLGVAPNTPVFPGINRSALGMCSHHFWITWLHWGGAQCHPEIAWVCWGPEQLSFEPHEFGSCLGEVPFTSLGLWIWTSQSPIPICIPSRFSFKSRKHSITYQSRAYFLISPLWGQKWESWKIKRLRYHAGSIWPAIKIDHLVLSYILILTVYKNWGPFSYHSEIWKGWEDPFGES